MMWCVVHLFSALPEIHHRHGLCNDLSNNAQTFLDGAILIWSPLITIAIKMLCTPSSFGPTERAGKSYQPANRSNRWIGRIERADRGWKWNESHKMRAHESSVSWHQGYDCQCGAQLQCHAYNVVCGCQIGVSPWAVKLAWWSLLLSSHPLEMHATLVKIARFFTCFFLGCPEFCLRFFIKFF